MVAVGSTVEAGDRAYAEAWASGVARAASDLPLMVRHVGGSKRDTETEEEVRILCAEGAEVVVGTRGVGPPPVRRALVESYPMTEVITADWVVQLEGLPNVTMVSPNLNDACFLAGLFAGIATQSETIGIVVGVEEDWVVKTTDFFETGVHYINPGVRVVRRFVSKNQSGWADPFRAKRLTREVIANGAEIIFQFAGGSGLGVIEACRDSDAWAIGVDMDQTQVAPGTVVTSAEVGYDRAAYEAIRRIVVENRRGTTVEATVSNGMLRLTPSGPGNPVPVDAWQRYERAIVQAQQEGHLQ